MQMAVKRLRRHTSNIRFNVQVKWTRKICWTISDINPHAPHTHTHTLSGHKRWRACMCIRHQWNLNGIAWIERCENVKSNEIHQIKRFENSELRMFLSFLIWKKCFFFHCLDPTTNSFIWCKNDTRLQVEMRMNSNWNLFTTLGTIHCDGEFHWQLPATTTTTNTNAFTTLVVKMKTSNKRIHGQCVAHMNGCQCGRHMRRIPMHM